MPLMTGHLRLQARGRKREEREGFWAVGKGKEKLKDGSRAAASRRPSGNKPVRHKRR